MPSNIEVLKLLGNKVNAQIITVLRRHPMSPRDLSKYLDKKEGDIVRRLKAMEKHHLVRGSWGNRLGQNVKLYSLVSNNISVALRQNGLQITIGKEKKSKPGMNRESATTAEVSIEEEEPQSHEEFPIVGRKSELVLIIESEKVNFFFITGIAGIGKTSLAKKYVQENGMSKASVFWHTFKEIDTFSYVIGRLALFLSKHNADDLLQQLDLFGVMQDESRSLEMLLKSLNRLKGCIFVFDDYHKVRDEKISVLLRHIQAKLLPANKTLVLSRSKAPFFLDNIKSKEIILDGLTLADSEKMISNLGTQVSDIALLNIWKRFRGHPMALKLFCMLMKEAEKKETAPPQNLSLDDLLSYFRTEILEVLSQDELAILLSLSVFRSPVKMQALSLVGNKRNLNYLLYSLGKKMLVSRTDNQEFFLHDLLRDVLYSVLSYPEEAHASAARYYLSEPTAQNIVEAIYHLIRAGELQKVFSIISEEVQEERYRILEEGYAAPLLEILNQISASGIDKKSLICLLNTEGKAYAMMEKWQESRERLDQALQIAEKLGDDILIAHTKMIIGEALYLKGEFAPVERYLVDAASLFKSHKAESNLKDIYMKLARMYFATGRLDESRQYSDLAMAISNRKG